MCTSKRFKKRVSDFYNVALLSQISFKTRILKFVSTKTWKCSTYVVQQELKQSNIEAGLLIQGQDL